MLNQQQPSLTEEVCLDISEQRKTSLERLQHTVSESLQSSAFIRATRGGVGASRRWDPTNPKYPAEGHSGLLQQSKQVLLGGHH